MAINPSSKLCFSRRLTYAVLFFSFLGLSVVWLSSLSSSVNKTTSSKAAGPDSIPLRDFGGKNQPCVFDQTRNEYYCNKDTNLVCDGSLDFWVSNDTTRFNYWKENKGQAPKCIDPVDVPMGKVGQLCRKEGQGARQCDSGLVCIEVFTKTTFPSPSSSFYQYFISQYKGNKLPGFKFNVDIIVEQWLELTQAIADFTHWNTEIKSSIFPLPRGICIPDSFTKVESCGDAGQKACKNELGQYFCFGENRKIYDVNNDGYNCGPKITISGKTPVRCDDLSSSCNEFCGNQKLKCVETCEVSNPFNNGDQSGVITVRGGLLVNYPYDGPNLSTTWRGGNCSQDMLPGVEIYLNHYGCNMGFKTNCCCDKK